MEWVDDPPLIDDGAALTCVYDVKESKSKCILILFQIFKSNLKRLICLFYYMCFYIQMQ